MSDAILDGIYMFGGKNGKGELQNKLRYLKPVTAENKVIGIDYVKIKQQGNSPCGRYGHTMGFLPVN